MDFIYTALGAVFGPIMRAIYVVVQNYGVAIIIFTIFCRLLMLPSAVSQQKNLAKNQRMQVKMRKIQEKYKDDKQRQQQEISDFYKREGYNPMSAGCSGGMVLQFPIMFGLIAAIYRPLQYILGFSDTDLKTLGDAAAKIFVDTKGKAQPLGLQMQLRVVEKIDQFKDLFGTGNGLIEPKYFDAIRTFADQFKLFGLNLGLTPKEGGSWVYYTIPILAGLAGMATSLFTFLRQRKVNPDQNQNAMMTGCMTFGMPLFSAYLALSFPVGIGIYWIVSSLVAFLQTVVLNYTHPPQKMLARVLVDETIQRRSRENSRKNIINA